MSIASEITRLQNAKASLKTSINAKSSTQITNETLEDYASFVDNIPSGGSSHDWSAIGYSSEPESIGDGYNYAVQIQQNWDATQSNLSSKFSGDTNLKYMPLVDTSNAKNTNSMFAYSNLESIPLLDISKSTNVQKMFQSCKALKKIPLLSFPLAQQINSMFSDCNNLREVPLFNLSNVTRTDYMFQGCKRIETVPQFNMSNNLHAQYMFSGCSELKNVPYFNMPAMTGSLSMFDNCPKLTDTSLDNILRMCISATSYANKTLQHLGFNATNYPASRIQALPHYQDFIDAGWTIGY